MHADITYTTNNELDLIIYVITWCYIKKKKCNVHLIYAVIDEVDSILIDEARTPLIISGQAAKIS